MMGFRKIVDVEARTPFTGQRGLRRPVELWGLPDDVRYEAALPEWPKPPRETELWLGELLLVPLPPLLDEP